MIGMWVLILTMLTTLVTGAIVDDKASVSVARVGERAEAGLVDGEVLMLGNDDQDR